MVVHQAGVRTCDLSGVRDCVGIFRRRHWRENHQLKAFIVDNCIPLNVIEPPLITLVVAELCLV